MLWRAQHSKIQSYQDRCSECRWRSESESGKRQIGAISYDVNPALKKSNNDQQSAEVIFR